VKQKISYNNQQIHLEIDPNNGLALIDGKQFEYEISEYNGRFYFRIGNKQWILANVQVKGTQIRFNIDGYPVQLQVKNEQALLLETLGMKSELKQSTKDIKAPMPGKVLTIEVKEGDQVQEGETILVLEAMKMENEIKSPIQGQIKTIQVEIGQIIDKQTLLVELE
tara:strand:+ start:1127 stop:1624 length:498 start_codon:yes stop_codon:yes gene_type:complete